MEVVRQFRIGAGRRFLLAAALFTPQFFQFFALFLSRLLATQLLAQQFQLFPNTKHKQITTNE